MIDGLHRRRGRLYFWRHLVVKDQPLALDDLADRFDHGVSVAVYAFTGNVTRPSLTKPDQI
jgi:hypothetical protein